MGRGSKRLMQSLNRGRNGLAGQLCLPSWAEAVYRKEQAESFRLRPRVRASPKYGQPENKRGEPILRQPRRRTARPVRGEKPDDRKVAPSERIVGYSETDSAMQANFRVARDTTS